VQTVGEVLRNEREKKGLSVKEIEIATSIRSLYITAIEEGNYSIIPGEVYLKGFIRNYSNYLGLDGQEIMDLYRQNQLPVAPVNETITPKKKEPPSEQEQPTKRNTNGIKWMTVSLLFICVAGGAWWLLDSSKSIEEPKITKQVQPAPKTPAEPTPEKVPAPTTPSMPSVPVQSKPVVITAKYTEQCWTSVTADNKNIFEGIPKEGDTITWEAEQNVTIKAGNAGGVDITYNGQPAGKLGANGEVVVKTFLPKK
jgi:cytoskeletal protein RodZ